MSERAIYRQTLARLFPNFGATVDIYAPGTVNASGSAGAMVQVAGTVPMLIVPEAEAGQIAPAPISIAGGRAAYLGIDPGTATLGLGCELRYSGGTFICEGTADWRLARVTLLSKVATPYHP